MTYKFCKYLMWNLNIALMFFNEILHFKSKSLGQVNEYLLKLNTNWNRHAL